MEINEFFYTSMKRTADVHLPIGYFAERLMNNYEMDMKTAALIALTFESEGNLGQLLQALDGTELHIPFRINDLVSIKGDYIAVYHDGKQYEADKGVVTKIDIVKSKAYLEGEVQTDDGRYVVASGWISFKCLSK